MQPLLPFLAAAQSRGDEVLVAVPPAMAYHVEQAGYPAHVCGEPPEAELAPLRELLPTLPPAEALVAGNRDLFGRLAASAMLPEMERLFSGWAPDLVVRDPCEYASAVVAERHGTPHVQVAISPAEGEIASIRAASPALEEHHRGLTSVLLETPYLSRFPPSMDPSPFAVTLRYREILDNPSAPGPPSDVEPLPDWWGGETGAARVRDLRDGARVHVDRRPGVPRGARRGGRSGWRPGSR